MLFSSPGFLFVFLPLCLLAFHLTLWKAGGTAAMGVSVLFSVFFYGWWNPPYLALLLGSIGGNFLFARRLSRVPSRFLLGLAIIFNLALLGYFKYRNFFLENIGFAVGETWSFGTIFIPLGISFFTFQQIALLIDSNDGEVSHPPGVLDYTQFVIFFPQLIAGPIILFRELSDQLADLRAGKGAGLALFGPGLVVFLMGLFKKVCLADNIAPFADIVFSHATELTMLEAWAGAVAYALQLYFDFSGYSDMAVGLGLLFGLCLPINFDTPFRAVSMIDFWKRWHMTMTRFFMMYLYAPVALSLNRFGLARFTSQTMLFPLTVAAPILLTFLVAGLWHGAGWTFILFGAVNGVGLVINHLWREAKCPALPRLLNWALTMLTVLISLVYFRAASVADAHAILATFFSPGALVLPNWLSWMSVPLGLPWATLVVFTTGVFTIKFITWVAALGVLSLVMPNPAKDYDRLVPTPFLAVISAVLVWMVLGWLDEPRTFLYFQF
ncbi:MAG TPA: MBOAT family O-acyltransferase [Alphaproteobacteria bacterium]|jgi:D-alanyl-lipoteichoic acid acyltransferase DltB (MBOAT superfamily)|nr:MBOAT family O-acyltransferase [Alphaproteobacteria bacterium]HJO89418.1 MBOAT family O-acyltransferase [Alphaproteobacteria bacterium]